MKPLVLLALFSAALPAVADNRLPVPRFNDPERRKKLEQALPEIDRIFAEYRERRGIPGLVYGVVIDGELAAVKAFGVQDRKSQTPVTPRTVFRIASMTKSFTALAILRLRDEGKLSLDDPISRWIPEFTRMPLPTGDSGPSPNTVHLTILIRLETSTRRVG